jgi:hypothetical protein
VGVDAAVALTRFLTPAVRRQLVARQFADVLPYFQDPVFAARVRGRLARLLAPALRRRERVLLLAYGFGSVVAYDVLWQLSHGRPALRLRDRRIAGLVTMGSPLGDKTVREHLLGWGSPLPQRYPTNITRWDNLSARGDAICHDARLANDVRPMRSAGCLEHFEERTGLCTVYRSREGIWNPHKLYGYLILPEVGRLVAQQVRGSSRPLSGL